MNTEKNRGYMAAEKSNRLPKELQNYKREVKKLPFKERVKAYFDCSPFLRDQDSQKKKIIISTFSNEEKKEFYRYYEPIYSAIEKYGDRVRAIDRSRILYANYIGSTLRKRNNYRYTADFLNLLLPKVEGALRGTEEAIARDNLKEIVDILHSYISLSVNPLGSPEITLNKELDRYEVTADEDQLLLNTINLLKGVLSLLKAYLEAIKEFLEWVGTPELLPREFKDMEADLLVKFQNINSQGSKHKNQDADKFPLLFARNKASEDFLSIDYKSLPKGIDLSGDKNLFANAYRRFFNY